LGDIVFIEVETEGEHLKKDETFGTIEAVKTVSDMFMPVSGEVSEFNGMLESNPEIVNKDPYGDNVFHLFTKKEASFKAKYPVF
ncbi:MAG: hypothetical protein HGA95_00840, partial [Caldiserica bacterium]|nr:hypothetical protein [Caldisericota bacterium]